MFPNFLQNCLQRSRSFSTVCKDTATLLFLREAPPPHGASSSSSSSTDRPTQVEDLTRFQSIMGQYVQV